MALGNNPLGFVEVPTPIGGTTPPLGGVNLVFSTLANAPLWWNGASWVPMWTEFQSSSRNAVINSGFSSTTLLTTDQVVRIFNNSGGPVFVAPPASPTIGTVTLKDETGNAGTFNILFSGTVDNVVNPTLINVNWGWASINWNGSSWARIG